MAYNANRVGVRDLRRHLKEHIDGGKVVEIGTPWELRAVLLPLGVYNRLPRDERRGALNAMQQLVRTILDAAVK